MPANRYSEARDWLADRAGISAVSSARDRMRALLRGPPLSEVPNMVEISEFTTEIVLRKEHRVLRCIATVDNNGHTEEHVSISARHILGFKTELPTWDELVAIRSIAWDDDAEVHQILPALTGPRADEWLSIAEVLHLRRIRK